MIFLQPSLLWGLFAAGVPVLVHLLNRLRYRSVKWAAIMFLLSANRSSTRHARLRQYLILLLRTLVILFIVAALSRPLTGGWLGNLLAGPPDTVIVLLDRSASMETVDPRVQKSRRAQALEIFSEAGQGSARSSRFVFIENALLRPQELAGLEVLGDLNMASATDTASDIPAMIRTAFEYMTDNRTGRTEIWIASDLQKTNWKPGNRQWSAIPPLIAGLPQDVTVRLLAMRDVSPPDTGISLIRTRKTRLPDSLHLEVTAGLFTSESPGRSFPVTTTFDGARSQNEISIQGRSTRRTSKLEIPPGGNEPGWGMMEVPPDANLRNNACYFVYGAPVETHSAVFAESAETGALLAIAAAPDPETFGHSSELITRPEAGKTDWSKASTAAWQGKPPAAETADSLCAFVEAGGTLLLMPPSDPAGDRSFCGLTWLDVNTVPETDPFRVVFWEERSGPLSSTSEGESLPLGKIRIYRRAAVETVAVDAGVDETAAPSSPFWHVLARYSDGAPFLLRRNIGSGAVFACTTLPIPEWSDLHLSPVFLPMTQRIIARGARRLSNARTLRCGRALAEGQYSEWECLTNPAADPRWEAGVYRHGVRLIALNRPRDEDDPAILEEEEAVSLFGEVNVRLYRGKTIEKTRGLHTELWPYLLGAALLCLAAESALLLFTRGKHRKERWEKP
ncbi:MAG: BatA domain-containing protein [Kiritimatiellia bacterium]